MSKWDSLKKGESLIYCGHVGDYVIKDKQSHRCVDGLDSCRWRGSSSCPIGVCYDEDN
jgi:hypothetical protein